MEKDKKVMLKILHIGPDPEFSSPIVYENKQVEIETMDNVFSVSHWIAINGLPDALVCERNLLGESVFEFYDFWVDKFDKDQRIPFILLEEHNQEKVLAVTERKIDGVLTKPASEETLIRQILMLRKDKPGLNQDQISDIEGFKPYKLTLLKRAFDIILASICLLIVSPILLIFMIAIRLETKGKVFYVSKRVGSGLQVFDFYKLRSMYAYSDKRLKELAHLNEIIKETSGLSTDKSPAEINSVNQESDRDNSTLQGDSRVTKVGYFMRKLNIDELPQLFNVIKGDLSMVGNRPLPLYEAELLTTTDWNDRFLGPAGVTGIWKVVSRRRLRSMSHEERNRLQNKYSKIAGSRNPFWKDGWVIIQTLPVLFKKGNP